MGSVSSSQLDPIQLMYINNIFPGAGIIASSNSSFIVSSCHMTHNQGGFIISSTDGMVTLQHSVFEGNKAMMQGGVLTSFASVVTIGNSVFMQNTANNMGGAAVFQNPSRAKIYNSTFFSNQVINGEGGALASYGQSLELYNCIVSQNSAGSIGGGIYLSLEKTQFKAVNVSLTGNNAKLNGGAVAIHSNYIDVAIDGCRFGNNSSGRGHGSALSVASKSLRIANSTFSEQYGTFLDYVDGSPSEAVLYTYQSKVIFGNVSYSTTEETFMQEMIKHCLIHIPEDMNVTKKETKFASGTCEHPLLHIRDNH